MERRIGVYICHCGTNIAPTVNVEEVAEFARSLGSVVTARDYKFMCADPGQALIKNDIKEFNLNRVVVASCSPRMHEPTFRQACKEAGLNPYLLEHVNIREHCSWVHKDGATEKAKSLIAAAVGKVYYHEPLEPREVPVNPNTLVVGGGIAGIQTALQIANGGHKVYLVEKESSIGGHMIQLDKTFPTLDCSACILTPKMAEVGSHPNIELLTYSEVEEVSGYVGNFKAKIRKKARYVDEDKCTGCGECIKGCSVSMSSEFEMEMVERKAVYIPFPQAVPNVATIDRREERPCKAACKDACPIHMNVPGYIALIKEGNFREAYELMRRTNPLPAICGRVCYAPCEDACNRGQLDDPLASRDLKRFVAEQIDIDSLEIPQIPKNGKKVAIVGSGPAGLSSAHDLALEGYDVTIFDALPEPGGMLRYGIPEYRLPKDILGREIGLIERLGVEIKNNARIGEDIQLKDLSRSYHAVFVATGAHESLKLGILGEDLPGVIPAVEFLRDINMERKVETGKKVAVIGGGNAAIDAARVARRLGAGVKIIYRRSRAEMPASPEEVKAAEEEGVEIMLLASPTRIIAQDGRVSKMECVRMELGTPDESGRRRPIPIEGTEFSLDVDTIIPALGQASNVEFVKELGLEVSPGGRIAIDEATLATNIEGIFAGGDVVTGPAMVIDAIAAGKKAACSIDEYLKEEPLTSKEDKRVPQKFSEEELVEIKKRFPSQNRVKVKELEPITRISDFGEVEQVYSASEALEESKRCLASQIEGCIGCGECEERCEAEAVNFAQQDEVIEVEAGAIIIATGYDTLNPIALPQYSYKKFDNILTSLEFERMVNASGPTGGNILLKDGREPKNVAIVHCVGSRGDYYEYCSRVCCMYALKFSHLIKEKTDAEIYQIYRDMRCFGKNFEDFRLRLEEEGVNFVKGKASQISQENGKLNIMCEDTLPSGAKQVSADMVILCTALEPRSNAEQVARFFTINQKADGFFMERHLKLAPVATASEGIFIAGCCQEPKDIPDTVVQASAAATQVLAMINRGKVEIEPTTSVINEEICSGCKTCIALCPFNAISFDEEKQISWINEALCKGCGVCAAACPSGAITARHFTTEQLLSEIEGVLV